MSIKSTVNIPAYQLTADFQLPMIVHQKMMESAILSSLAAYAANRGPVVVLLNFGQIVQNAIDIFKREKAAVEQLDDKKKKSFYLQFQEKEKYLGKAYDSEVLFASLCEKFNSEEYTGQVISMNPGNNKKGGKKQYKFKGAHGNFMSVFRTLVYEQFRLPSGESLKDLGIEPQNWWNIMKRVEDLFLNFLHSDNQAYWRRWAEIDLFYQVKNGKPNNQLQNVRPIVKLPLMVRIFERTLAKRIKSIFYNKIDHNAQKSNLMAPAGSGHGLNHNCFQLEDFLRSTKKQGLALFFDIAKAYSSVDHEIMLDILQKNISNADDSQQVIYKYLANYYHFANYNIAGKNGNPDRTVYVRRGLLQGSTLSNYLFIIYMDAFLKELKKRLELLGVLPDMFYGPDHSIKAFVDDIVLFCPKSTEMAFAVSMTIRAVAKVFKFELNVGKSRYLTNDGSAMDLTCNSVPIPPFAAGERYLGRYVVQPPEIVAEVFIQHMLHPLMERINSKTKNRMKYYRKSITSRVFYQFIKTAAPPAFLDMVTAFESGYLLNWGMSAEDVTNYLYARNYHFIRERKWRLTQFNEQGINTPYIQGLVHVTTGYDDAPAVPYEKVQEELDDVDYLKMQQEAEQDFSAHVVPAN